MRESGAAAQVVASQRSTIRGQQTYREIRHHHHHRPEECLEVVGQLSASSVAGVHGDEDAARRAQVDLAGEVAASELEAVGADEQRLPDGEQLLRLFREESPTFWLGP